MTDVSTSYFSKQTFAIKIFPESEMLVFQALKHNSSNPVNLGFQDDVRNSAGLQNAYEWDLSVPCLIIRNVFQ